MDTHNQVAEILKIGSRNDDLGKKVREALEIVSYAYKLYKKDGLLISYNGESSLQSNEDKIEELKNALKLTRKGSKKRSGIVQKARESTDTNDEDRLNELYLSNLENEDSDVKLYFKYIYNNESSKCENANPEEIRNIAALYITSNTTFIEMDQFVSEIEDEYKIKITRMDIGKGSMINSLKSYLDSNPKKKGVFIGTRRDDPVGITEYFKLTDKGWPRVMRISPILDWEYNEVWDFIINCKIPYCALYDKGYTSLGDSRSTSPNPILLRKINDATSSNTNSQKGSNGYNSEGEYEPAWKLKDCKNERVGRHNK
ncbi:putative FAD synthase [Zancudomyces culisetae]|uniref:FAD synthase n=1 Tax=Zancudomyces culisetae TaxID=1213189 RepID=A0A1R1PSY7_ZANCU|nr:putative FAD synthase [Zancudomyces culisetae]|eukprot:OMH84078.1 putative FAD synthase [Zancudomyces culisetae]